MLMILELGPLGPQQPESTVRILGYCRATLQLAWTRRCANTFFKPLSVTDGPPACLPACLLLTHAAF